MNQFLSIFIYFAVLQFCVSEPECIEDPNLVNDNTTIYVLYPKSNEAIETNYDLQNLHNFVQSVNNRLPLTLKIIPEFCPGGVKGTLKAIEYYPNIIHFFVSDFYVSNYATILKKNLFFGGKTRVKNNSNCTGNGSDLETLPDTCFDVLLISESIIEFTDLYRLILSYWTIDHAYSSDLYLKTLSVDNSPEPLAILVCSEERYSNSVDNTRHNIQIIYEYHNRCSKKMTSVQDSSQRLIAILAPTPFTMNHETLIPTLFYNHPYLTYEDKNKFPNSVSIFREWKPLKLAFVAFMRKMGWKRVAMISDDSEYSEAFETEMLHELNSYGFTYHSYGCSYKPHCDLDELVNSMFEAIPRIVIVNIGEENGIKFLDSIRYRRIGNIVWLVRDWPFPENDFFEYRPRRFYSISLGIQNSHHLPDIIDRFNAGFNTILDACRSLTIRNNEALSSKRKNLYRKLNEKYHHHSEVNALITEVTIIQKNLKMIYKIDKHSNVEEILHIPFHINHPDRRCDIIGADNYFEPCGDQDILLLLLVVIVFCIVLLLVVYYVNNVAYTNSYTNL